MWQARDKEELITYSEHLIKLLFIVPIRGLGFFNIANSLGINEENNKKHTSLLKDKSR